MTDFDVFSAPAGYTYADESEPIGDVDGGEELTDVITDEADEQAAEDVPEATEDLTAPEDATAPSGVREAPEVPEADDDDEADDEVAEPEATEGRRTHRRGGPADFGNHRQPKGSATHSEALFSKLLVDGSVTVVLDGESKALAKLADTPGAAAGTELERLRKVVLNRILNRILKGGGYKGKHDTEAGCVKVEKVNAQTRKYTLLRAPAYFTPTGRVSATGKVALALLEAGKTLCDVASDAELDALIATLDSEADSE